MNEERADLKRICTVTRSMVKNGDYEECDKFLRDSIGKYPHAAEIQNLFGVLLKKQGNHVDAMKHFRASWALDPTYLPSRYNLDQYTSFYPRGVLAYDESDCPEVIQEKQYELKNDEDSVGRIIRRIK